MRVGVLAKGLLLHERLDVQLVVLCQGNTNLFFIPDVCLITFNTSSFALFVHCLHIYFLDRPTTQLLERVSSKLPEQMTVSNSYRLRLTVIKFVQKHCFSSKSFNFYL